MNGTRNTGPWPKHNLQHVARIRESAASVVVERGYNRLSRRAPRTRQLQLDIFELSPDTSRFGASLQTGQSGCAGHRDGRLSGRACASLSGVNCCVERNESQGSIKPTRPMARATAPRLCAGAPTETRQLAHALGSLGGSLRYRSVHHVTHGMRHGVRAGHATARPVTRPTERRPLHAAWRVAHLHR